MPTRKIRDIDELYMPHESCRHPEHEPPKMQVFSPGEYEHECPGCERIIRFKVYPLTMQADTIRPHVHPMAYVVHRPASVQREDPPSNPMHAIGHGRGDTGVVRETRTCSSCGEQAYRHHIC